MICMVCGKVAEDGLCEEHRERIDEIRADIELHRYILLEEGD